MKMLIFEFNINILINMNLNPSKKDKITKNK